MTRSMEIPDAAVEAAAKAACEATYPPNPSGRVKVHDSWEEIEEWERDAWRTTARAALVAARPYLMPTREEIAEVLAIRWTQPLDLMNRREDWTYPERPMSERINSEVDASYRSGPPEDSSLVLRAPTCLEIADAVLALLNGES